MQMPPRIALVAAAVVLFASAAFAQTAKYGSPVTVAKATPIADLYASPDTFVGKTIRVDGVASSVCTEMGCWVAVIDAAHPDQAVRFQAEHDGKIVFPIALKGKAGSFQGEFVRIAADDHEAREAAAEHAHAEPKAAGFGSRYQIKVAGWVSGTLEK
jgi:hypothetical protein